LDEIAVKPLTGSVHQKSNFSSLRRLRVATILLVASFAALVIAAGIYNLTQQYRVEMDTAGRTARNTVKTLESHATQTLGETYRIMEGISDVYKRELERGSVDEFYLHRMLADKLSLAPSVASFFVANEKFEGIAGSRTFPVDISGIYRSGMSFESFDDVGGNLLLGRVYKNRIPSAAPDDWGLPLGVKVIDSNGRLRGYIFAVIRTKYFSDYFLTLDIGANSEVGMWTPDNVLIASTPNASLYLGQTAPMPIAGADVETRVTGQGLEREVMAYSNIDTLPLKVSVTLNAEDFLATWRGARNTVALAVVGIVLAMTVFALIILRQIARTEDNELALRRATAVAEEANEAKSRFLAHMSHEFRTPLNAIMGFSEIIKNKVLGDSIAAPYISYADHIHRSGEHLLNIVNDILDMAKIESGAQPLHREAISVPGVIAAAVSFTEGLAKQKGIAMRIVMAENLPTVSGDQRFSRQVVINLLSNAIKFSPPHSEIVISARYIPGKFLDISVRDHGPGIEPALLQRLGEPFLQGNPSVSQMGQGTGLGLSICKRYMALLGGELLVDSIVGSGTTASIRFPQNLLIPPHRELKRGAAE